MNRSDLNPDWYPITIFHISDDLYTYCLVVTGLDSCPGLTKLCRTDNISNLTTLIGSKATTGGFRVVPKTIQQEKSGYSILGWAYLDLVNGVCQVTKVTTKEEETLKD